MLITNNKIYQEQGWWIQIQLRPRAKDHSSIRIPYHLEIIQNGAFEPSSTRPTYLKSQTHGHFSVATHNKSHTRDGLIPDLGAAIKIMYHSSASACKTLSAVQEYGAFDGPLDEYRAPRDTCYFSCEVSCKNRSLGVYYLRLSTKIRARTQEILRFWVNPTPYTFRFRSFWQHIGIRDSSRIAFSLIFSSYV